MSQDLIIKETGIFARAELDVQISTAKAYPRNKDRCVSYAVELATMDEETAQSCFYVLARKNKDGGKSEIRGPSIRLAEIICSAWGNIHAATRIVENDGRFITAEAVCWDLENNVRIAAQNKVSIWFGEDKKKGNPGYQANADMQTVLSNAASSKALRNSIFKVIPKALINIVLEKAMTFSVGDQKSLNVKRNEVFEKLVKMGIDKQKILDYYGKPLNDFDADDLRSLIGVGVALKEGHMKKDDAFSVIDDTQKPENNAAERLDNLTSRKHVDSKIDEVEFIVSFETIKRDLSIARDIDSLHLAADKIRNIDDEVLRDELSSIYNSRKNSLEKNGK